MPSMPVVEVPAREGRAVELRAGQTVTVVDVVVPAPINLFMNTPFLPDGQVRWLPTETAAGDAVVLRALLDCVVVVSACPQDVTGINASPGPLRLEIGA